MTVPRARGSVVVTAIRRKSSAVSMSPCRHQDHGKHGQHGGQSPLVQLTREPSFVHSMPYSIVPVALGKHSGPMAARWNADRSHSDNVA